MNTIQESPCGVCNPEGSCESRCADHTEECPNCGAAIPADLYYCSDCQEDLDHWEAERKRDRVR